jgi:hypothetical protein
LEVRVSRAVIARRLPCPLLLAVLAGADVAPALAGESVVKLSGQLNYGVSSRLESPDPNLLNTLNAAASGQRGSAGGGQNSDDADTNFQRHDAVSSVLKGYAELSVAHGPFSLMLRARAWRDFALRNGARAFGNATNDYTAGAPLSDAGAPSLSRFSGLQLTDYSIDYRAAPGAAVPLLLRVGQQVIGWGGPTGFFGGLSGVNAFDTPAMRRPGAVAQETRVAAPAVFAHLDLPAGLAAEGYVQTAFRPSAVDMCGTFYSASDYMVAGCDKVMAGLPLVDDRERVRTGGYMKRLFIEPPRAPSQHGLALLWHGEATELGLYHARLTSRTPMPGLQKSTRPGAAIVPGDPDGKNMRFFTEYLDGIEMSSLTWARRVGTARLAGELTYRAGQPLLISPSDVIPAFLSAVSPSLLRADATATAPGGLFHGSDRYNVVHASAGLQGELGSAAGIAFSGALDGVYKHVISLPDPARRRYGRADQFGAGPVFGVCTVNTATPALQCSENGYVSANAAAVRVRVEARTHAPGLDAALSLMLTDDVRGWSYDNLISEGRKSASITLRLVYQQHYLAEIVVTPIWGGQYNAMADRDLLSLSVGIRF